MRLIFILFFFGYFIQINNATNQPELVSDIYSDSLQAKPDTLKSFLLKKEQLFCYSPHLHNQNSTLFNKILLGTGYASSFNVSMGLYLLVAPDYITNWHKVDKFKLPTIFKQYHASFTKPPVIDTDLWFVNYIGHPYQGGFYYNSFRSQGATVLQSSIFCFCQSVLWEYGWEAGMEQPSIQDLIVTPLLGILVGELSHVATLQLSKNGYTWYEKLLVCLIDPTYAINNGFKVKRVIKY